MPRSMTRSLAYPNAPPRRALLLVLFLSAGLLAAPRPVVPQDLQTSPDPIQAPGQTLTPELKAQQRDANRNAQEQILRERAAERNALQRQQFENDRTNAQIRENRVQQQLDLQRLDILNNRDKP